MPELSDFAGEWALTREIRHADGSEARFEGAARFVPEGEGLLYLEEGALILPGGQRMRAERRYLWRTEGGRIAVFFEDGRPFHSFAPDAPEAAHWCDPDDYRVTYEFAHWPDWRAEWRVRGPRKDYVMISDYRPA
ncbi:DUF6314 family protein [Thioclava atlantica]|uniref:DUF6314 domain-containing protein n=1 Tax=Thioclava atlantica TaxID=1317124 RepID=A0A085TUL3_9RHOB|nr:DUF6314 family protein [Thioclava atlantica]KFE34410.1 hypothetical protein DW2_12695 [Thioclava atlantica]